MISLPIYSPLYTFVLVALYMVLSGRVIYLRNAKGIVIGHGEDRTLQKAIRSHGNFAEYVPLCVIILVVMEIQQGPTMTLHLCGFGLIIGRILHSIGLSRRAKPSPARFFGTVLTGIALVAAASSAAWYSIGQMMP
jgi:uncharacterized protein